MASMNKTLLAIWNREENELRKQEQAWIDTGGSPQHFLALRAYKSHLMQLFEHGPTGFGPLPSGCRLETSVQWLKQETLIRSHDVAVASYRLAMLRWTSAWFIANKMKSMTVFANRYVLHWHTEAIGTNRCHACWDLENERVNLNLIRLDEYMAYLFLKGLGHPDIPEFNKVLSAIQNGYWPIGFEHGLPIVLKCNEKDILPRVTKKRTSK